MTPLRGAAGPICDPQTPGLRKLPRHPKTFGGPLKQAARLQFTDGLNTIVLVECGHKCSPSSQCVIPHGSTHLVARLDAPNLALAATGDVSPAELMKMLRSTASATPVAYPKRARPPLGVTPWHAA